MVRWRVAFVSDPLFVMSVSAQAATAERQRVREIREAFDYFDRNHDGRIDYPDFGTVLRSLGALISEAELAAAKEELEFPLTWDDFLPLASRKLQTSRATGGHLDAEIVRAFETFDVRARGRVAVKDLRHFLTTLGERITNEEFELAIKYANIPLDQAEVNYTEFLRILHSSSS